MAYPHECVASVDFETRSPTSLRACGSWRYAMDPATEILCMAFRLPQWAPGRTGLWHPEFPSLGIVGSDSDDLPDLLDWVMEGRPVEAHNAWFERGVWEHILVPRHGWPTVDRWQWRCSAAKAAALTLPRGLEEAARVLRLKQQKDLEGSKLMKKLCQPRKPRKAEWQAWELAHPNTVMPFLWWESREWFEQLWAYCRRDVLTEAELSAAIPDLAPEETELYLLDQEINQRGFQLDKQGVSIALSFISKETPVLNAELCQLTGGAVKKATQRAKMLAWFGEQGLDLPDTRKETIAGVLDTAGMPNHPAQVPHVHRALELVRMLGKSSTAKYQSMRSWACPDGRVRGGLLFHGAGTGRWSGAGVQPQNFVRGIVKDMVRLWEVLKTRDRELVLDVVSGMTRGRVVDLMDVLSQALRGAIIAPNGRVLYVADYAAIEARCVLWLAGDEDALDIFRRGEDIYCDFASDVYGYPVIPNPEKQPPERPMGKQGILGLGYQMGGPKFQTTCAAYGLHVDKEFAQRVVDVYRERFWRVVDMWADQEAAAKDAASSRRRVPCGRVTWFREGDYLYCELPSSRRLAYPQPQVRPWETSWGSMKPSLTFMGVNPYTRQWQRRSAYGGLLVENITQAVARDLMAAAIKRCDQSGVYDVVLSVHDELIAEANAGTGSVAEFVGLLTDSPAWADGCPVEAEGWTGVRYHK